MYLHNTFNMKLQFSEPGRADQPGKMTAVGGELRNEVYRS